MKCDELKAETIVPQGSAITLQMYGKAEVDAAIAELRTEIESLKASHYSEMVDAGMRERKLKRALLLMCARLGKMGYLAFHNIEVKLRVVFLDFEGAVRASKKKEMWKTVERKCRARAEEYK